MNIFFLFSILLYPFHQVEELDKESVQKLIQNIQDTDNSRKQNAVSTLIQHWENDVVERSLTEYIANEKDKNAKRNAQIILDKIMFRRLVGKTLATNLKREIDIAVDKLHEGEDNPIMDIFTRNIISPLFFAKFNRGNNVNFNEIDIVELFKWTFSKLVTPASKNRFASVCSSGANDPKFSFTKSLVATFLNDPDKYVIMQALQTLGTVKATEFVSEITELIHNPDTQIRDAAVNSLANLGPNILISALPRLLLNSDIATQEYIVLVLVNCLRVNTYELELNSFEWPKATLFIPFQDSATYKKILADQLKENNSKLEPFASLIVGLSGDSKLLNNNNLNQISSLLDKKSEFLRQFANKALVLLKATSQTNAIAKLLQNEDPSVRLDGLKAIELINAQAHTNDFIELLKDKDGTVRAHAVVALSRLKSNKIVEALQDPDPNVKGNAVWGLSNISPNKYKDAILKSTNDNTEFQIFYDQKKYEKLISIRELVESIIREQFETIDSDTSEQVSKLFEKLNDKDLQIRNNSLNELIGFWNNKGVIALVIKTIDQANEQKNQILAANLKEALQQIKFRKELGEELVELLGDKLSQLYKADENAKPHEQPSIQLCVQWLRYGILKSVDEKIKDRLVKWMYLNVTSGKYYLLQYLTGEQRTFYGQTGKETVEYKPPFSTCKKWIAKFVIDSNYKTNAITALGNIKASEYSDIILSYLNSTKETEVQAAIGALSLIDGNKYAEQISHLLKDKRPQIRLSAASTLARIDFKRYGKQIIQLLYDPDPTIIYSIMHVIKEYATSDIADNLADFFRQNKKQVAGWFPLQTLAKIGGAKYTDLIAEFLDVKHMEQDAVVALGELGAKQYADKIAKFLTTHDECLKSAVISVLGNLGAKQYAKQIAELLFENESFVPQAAVKALAQLEATDLAKEYTKSIVKYLNHNDPGTKIYAIKTLYTLNAKEYTNEIAKLINDTGVLETCHYPVGVEKEEVKATVEEVLSKWKVEPLSLVTELEEDLKTAKDNDNKIEASKIAKVIKTFKSRLQSGAELKTIFDELTVTKMTSWSEDETFDNLYEWLKEPGKHGLNEPQKLNVVVHWIYNKLKTSEGKERFARFVGNLARNPNTNSASFVKLVAKLFKDENWTVRRESVEIIGSLNAKEYTKEITNLLSDQNDQVRGNAIDALAKLGGAESKETLADLLNSNNFTDKWHGIFALNHIEASEYTDKIVEVMRKDPKMAYPAITTLGKFGANQYIDEIAGYLTDQSDGVRAVSAVALAKLGASKYVDKIAKLLKDDSSQSRGYAIWALGKLGAKQYSDTIAKIIQAAKTDNTYDHNLRGYAIWAIGEFGLKEHSKLIAEQINSKDHHASKNAIKALVKLDAKEYAKEIASVLTDKNHMPYVKAEAILALDKFN
ncbi:MAG: HEAT repeat domain-containing protein, partial [Planctomycetes bacterium]|nr:HEAT repeat domain-containing protein [Planctomycetota bacterium]